MLVPKLHAREKRPRVEDDSGAVIQEKPKPYATACSVRSSRPTAWSDSIGAK